MITLMMTNAERIEAMTKFIELNDQLIHIDHIIRILKTNNRHSEGGFEIEVNTDRYTLAECFSLEQERDERWNELKKLLCGDEK